MRCEHENCDRTSGKEKRMPIVLRQETAIHDVKPVLIERSIWPPFNARLERVDRRDIPVEAVAAGGDVHVHDVPLVPSDFIYLLHKYQIKKAFTWNLKLNLVKEQELAHQN